MCIRVCILRAYCRNNSPVVTASKHCEPRYDRSIGDEDGMAVATLGRVDEFDGARDDWPQYVERLEHFFTANGIEDAEKKRSVLLTVIGAATYKTLRNILAPAKPGDKTYAQLVEALTKYYKPAPSEIVQRFKFHSRVRKEGESIAAYLAELRSLSEYCNFGETLDTMIRDRLVCGVQDNSIQRRLLAEPELTYQTAVDLALGAETAAKSQRELGSQRAPPTPPSATVSAVAGTGKPAPVCYRCGRKGHTVPNCKISKSVVCHKCKKRGHLQRVCKSQPKRGGSQGTTRAVREELEVSGEDLGDDPSDLYHIRCGKRISTPPIVANVKLDGCWVDMEVDSGASFSLMSEATFRRLWPGRDLHPSSVRLQTYSKEPITVVGCCNVNIEYNGQTGEMPLEIVAGSGPTLFGRDWMSKISLDWGKIHQVHNAALYSLLNKYTDVFSEGLGTLKGFKAKIYVDPDAPPRFHAARSVPFALRDLVERELQRLQTEGTIEPVEMAEWAAPIVAVVKKDKSSVRICGDFRVTVNPVSKLDRYPIPKVEDLFAKLSKGKLFSKLDMRQAYQQIELEEESKKYVVINTQRGLFQYTRLPFGIASAPGIFQRVIENILQGIEGVVVYLDDILITGSTEEAHLRALETVLTRLNKSGLRLKRNKCEFLRPSVTYLGHRVDADGLHPLMDRVQAISEAPTPRSTTELRSYLGMLTYYGKFLPNLSSTLHPLLVLLKKEAKWRWGTAQAKAFAVTKKLLTSDTCLTHFDSSLDLILACDASAYGLGAVLSHRMPDGTERPIAYSSRTLNPSEKNYSQLEKEGLACIFGIKKYHPYIFGRPFQLVTDHKPLLGLLKEDHATSQQASSRIKRWSLFLANYEYQLVFRSTTAHANADALSRLPLPVWPAKVPEEPELVMLAEHLVESPITARDIRIWTQRDKKLARVLQHIQQGWPNCGDADLEPFSSRRLELSSYEGCILWGTRVVVPQPGREAVLQELHEGHPGITRMKALARMYVWWPGITADIEQSVRLCSECQNVQSSPPPAPLHPWKWPTRPWARLHLDFAGPVEGKNILIVVDAHSKWVEAVCTSSVSSSCVIEELRTLFARFGLPEMVVTDNGTCFVSREFEDFLRKNGVKHTTTAPYHPSSNGMAERAVQVIKRGLKKVREGSMRSRLARILFTYRITPQGTTGLAPTELLLGRRPRTRLDLLKPHTAERVEGRQLAQKTRHDRRSTTRSFQLGDAIFLKNFTAGAGWLPGKVTEKIGPVTYQVVLEDGRRKRCHQEQLRPRVTVDGPPEMSEVSTDADVPVPITGRTDSEAAAPQVPTGPCSEVPEEPATGTRTNSFEPNDSRSSESINTPSSSTSEASEPRYPRRLRKPRRWFEPGKD